MKRNLSTSSPQEETINPKVPKPSLTFDFISELINNRQTDQLKACLENSWFSINLKNDDSLLMKACKVGDEECVKFLLSRGADVSFASHYSGHTALTLACRYGHESIIKLLLERGAAVNPTVGLLPLVEASGSSNVGVVELLLNSGARVNDQPSIVCTDPHCGMEFFHEGHHYHLNLNALMTASSNGHAAIVALLLKHGANIETKLEFLPHDDYCQEGFSALNFASYSHHWDVVKLLVAGGADINKINIGEHFEAIHHLTPLMYACVEGNIDVVKELLDLGADINSAIWHSAVDDPYSSPLILASTHGHIDLVKFILAHEQFTARETIPYALVEACNNDQVDIAELLRAHVDNVDVFGVGADTPLAKACEQGGLESVQLLLDLGADVNVPANASGGTALMRACAGGRVKAAKLLLGLGALVDVANNRGETALMTTCHPIARQSLIPLLIEHGADVNKTNTDGSTTLMLSISLHWNVLRPVLKLLLDYGADVTVKNRRGETVFDLLRSKTDISTELRREYIALCKQYEEGNCRDNATTAPVLK